MTVTEDNYLYAVQIPGNIFSVVHHEKGNTRLAKPLCFRDTFRPPPVVIPTHQIERGIWFQMHPELVQCLTVIHISGMQDHIARSDQLQNRWM